MQQTMPVEILESSATTALFQDEAERLLLAANALDDATMRLLARSADLENLALAEVARFETQRTAVMEALASMHAAEISGGMAQMPRDRFLGAEQEKLRLWANVESLWAQSRRCLLWASERQARAARARDEAARMFEQAMAIGSGRAQTRTAA